MKNNPKWNPKEGEAAYIIDVPRIREIQCCFVDEEFRRYGEYPFKTKKEAKAMLVRIRKVLKAGPHVGE